MSFIIFSVALEQLTDEHSGVKGGLVPSLRDPLSSHLTVTLGYRCLLLSFQLSGCVNPFTLGRFS